MSEDFEAQIAPEIERGEFINKNSVDWLVVEKKVRRLLAAARRDLEIPDKSFDKTQVIRGQINAFRVVLSLPDPELRPEAEEEEPIDFELGTSPEFGDL
jgi:hypothetical protein